MRQKAAQSGVHSLVALAAMAVAVVGATTTPPKTVHAAASVEQTTELADGCQKVSVLKTRPTSGEEAHEKTDADDYKIICLPVKRPRVSRACHEIVMTVGKVKETFCYGTDSVASAVQGVVSVHASVVKKPVSAPVAKSTAPSPSLVAVATATPSSSGVQSSGVDFCAGQTIVWPANISQWTAPVGCYAQIFTPNPANYPYRPSFGWCDWTPEEMHLNYSGSSALFLMKHWQAPQVGAVVWFNPGDQGASSAGHWAQLIALGPNGKALILEMNFTWRGGGFGREDYRFINAYDPGVAYLYA